MDKKPINKQVKSINEHFFDRESKEMWYVLGVSYSRYIISRKDNRNSWTSSSHELLEIIQTQLEAEHKIGKQDGRKERLFQVRSQYLQYKLKERGLGVPKKEREFPKDCNEKYLDHFIRGFFDAHVSLNEDRGNRIISQIYFNITFLKELHNHFVKCASVDRDSPEKSPLRYGNENTMKIYCYLYRDWDFIQENGLYLPSKKEGFKSIDTIVL